MADQEGGRRHAGDGSGGGNDQDVAFATSNRIERCQALRDQILVRRETVVGEGFPVGKMVGAQLRRKPGEFFDQPLRIRGLGGDHQQEASAGRQFGDGQGIGRTGDTR